jgi:hypothetical protein
VVRFTPEKGSSVTIRQEAGWAREPDLSSSQKHVSGLYPEGVVMTAFV